MPAKEYQGHESWNAWNVSLYIANDYLLYSTAVEALKATRTVRQAADRFFALTGLQNTKTPDGANYSARSVGLALMGLEINQKED